MLVKNNTFNFLELSLAAIAISRASTSFSVSHECASWWNNVPILSPSRTLIMFPAINPLHACCIYKWSSVERHSKKNVRIVMLLVSYLVMITGIPASAALTAAFTLAVIPPLPTRDLSPNVISSWCLSLMYVCINFDLGSPGGPLYRPSTSLSNMSRSAFSSKDSKAAKLSLSQNIPEESYDDETSRHYHIHIYKLLSSRCTIE